MSSRKAPDQGWRAAASGKAAVVRNGGCGQGDGRRGPVAKCCGHRWLQVLPQPVELSPLLRGPATLVVVPGVDDDLPGRGGGRRGGAGGGGGEHRGRGAGGVTQRW